MSVEVKPEQLAAALERYDFAYLVTVSEQAQSHIVAVIPTLDGNTLTVRGLGRRTHSNAEGNPMVTLVWPPVEAGDYSLIVDGAATLGEDALTLVPSRAVLHRSAPRPDDAVGADGCESDCKEL